MITKILVYGFLIFLLVGLYFWMQPKQEPNLVDKNFNVDTRHFEEINNKPKLIPRVEKGILFTQMEIVPVWSISNIELVTGIFKYYIITAEPEKGHIVIFTMSFWDFQKIKDQLFQG